MRMVGAIPAAILPQARILDFKQQSIKKRQD
jgi:hypothetical protein